MTNQVSKPFVVCAAIRKEGLVICGARHFDRVMHAVISYLPFDDGYWLNAEQGFIDQRGKFLTREKAADIAKENDQVIVRKGQDKPFDIGKLYSEDLY